MKLPIYQVDAFADAVFKGNPAAVCPLEAPLPEATMRAIASENNLSETAFIVRAAGGYDIRWFTPKKEIDLCGHATLASAFVVFEILEHDRAEVTFASKSGPLVVTKSGDRLSMLFPARPPSPIDASAPNVRALVSALGREPVSVLAARDYVAVFASDEDVRGLDPDMTALTKLDRYGTIVTAPGDGRECDFVSRFFAPAVGVPEDPVTGSAHCTLVPYWAERLGKTTLRAIQRSERGGTIACEAHGDKVTLAGRAVLYLEGAIYV